MATAPPYDAPPSYESVIRGLCYVPEMTSNQLSVVDFIPEEATVRFPTLISRSNEWLRNNPQWEARACESVEFKSKGGIPSVQRVVFTERNTRTTYVRGLRLWLVPRRDPHLGPQQLGYFDTVPDAYHEVLRTNFERFKSVMDRVNNKLLTNPINGLIITVETQPMKYSRSLGAVESDKSYFTDFGFSVFVIRVFYEIGTPAHESVGVIDFFPKYENGRYNFIPNLVSLASQWARNKPFMRISNVQTVAMKMKPLTINSVDEDKMSIFERRGKNQKTRYLRILRLFYVRTPETVTPIIYMSPFQGPLTCKTFLPIQLNSRAGIFSVPEFESTQKTLTRISEWVKAHNVKILSAETYVVRMYTGDAKYGPESTYFYNMSVSTERFITTFRLYLDGDYPDPHISMCPIAFRGWASDPVTNQSSIPSSLSDPGECTIN